MRSGASGVACLDASFAVSADARSRVPLVFGPFHLLRLLVNVLRRTRRDPSTIKGAAPDVVFGQSTAARAGARPYQRSLSQNAEIRLLNCSSKTLRLLGTCCAGRAGTHLRSEALHRMSFSDNLQRLAW